MGVILRSWRMSSTCCYTVFQSSKNNLFGRKKRSFLLELYKYHQAIKAPDQHRSMHTFLPRREESVLKGCVCVFGELPIHSVGMTEMESLSNFLKGYRMSIFQKLKECVRVENMCPYLRAACQRRVARTALVHLNVSNPNFFSPFQYWLIAGFLGLAAINHWKL